MNCTAAIIGSVSKAVHSVAKPSDAPALVYVPMPDGSSSEAPVISPGPRNIRKRLRGFVSRSILDSSASSCALAGLSFDRDIKFCDCSEQIEVSTRFYPIKRKRAAIMTAHSRCELFWLGGRDSNPDSQIQSLESYHWTTSQRRIRIYGSLRFKSTEPFNGSCPALVFSARSQRPPRLCGEFAINALTA